MKAKFFAVILPFLFLPVWMLLLFICHPPLEQTTTRGVPQAAKSDDLSQVSSMTLVPASIQNAEQCLPWLKEQQGPYTHFELICSESAWQAEGEPLAITKNFEAPASLSRRVRFWHRIYSLFSPQDYVIHLAEHPEVILEIIHDPNFDMKLSAGPKLRSHLKDRRQFYSEMLKTMDRLSESEWSPQMTRIAVLMSHISQKHKFREAAKAVRSQRGQRDYVKRGIEAASAYLPWIEEEFDKRSLPRELARIAFVESSFNLRAVSKVGASGVYQLMPFVARTMMKVGSDIDERRDPIKAGIGAAEVFQKNYRMLEHWPLAVTAYNHGPYGIKRAVKQSQSTDLSEIIQRYRSRIFGFASKNFYAEFLGMLLTLKQADQYFPGLELKAPIQFENYTLKKAKRIRTLAQKFNTDVDALAKLNPDILPSHVRRNGLLPKGYQIKLPKNEVLAENWQEQAWQIIIMDGNQRLLVSD
ncbi:MAG: lytic transglycosylase domain-containing protein [Oligoflexus sp.]